MSGKNVLGRVLTVLGAVLILAALSLVLYNYRHEHESKKTMDNVLVRLDNEIPDEPQKEEASPFDVFDADDGYSDDSTAEVSDEDESLSLDGDEYIGIISLPALDREYPILKYWSYPNMNIAPCRYDGIRAGRDLIICGHKIVFAVKINCSRIKHCIYSKPFHKIGIGLGVKIIPPYQRSMIGSQHRVDIPVIHTVIALGNSVFTGDQAFILLLLTSFVDLKNIHSHKSFHSYIVLFKYTISS